MPLVVPGIMNKPKDSQQEWLTKLMGKKISDTYDENVSPLKVCAEARCSLILQSFAKKDLPEAHRVVKDGDFTTQDMKPDR